MNYKCRSCIYYCEEYAPYIKALVPICTLDTGNKDYRCKYTRKGADSNEMSIQNDN